MKLVMFGTKDYALPTFEAIADSGHEVVALVTQPDRPQGRKREFIPSPIKLAAIARGIAVHQPDDVNVPESVAAIRGFVPDLLVTAAYGQILSGELLGVAPLGGINLHGSILPKYRGAAPVARAIQNGETETGVTVILMTPRIDAGGMIAVARTPIGPDETAGDVEARLAEIGVPLILKTIADLASGSVSPLPQSRAKVTRAPKLTKDDGRIDWNRSAVTVHDLVRAMQPWPQTETFWHPSSVTAKKGPVRLIVSRTTVVEGSGAAGTVLAAKGGILEVAASDKSVRLLEVQVPGKKSMPAADFLRGHFVHPGDRMGHDSD